MVSLERAIFLDVSMSDHGDDYRMSFVYEKGDVRKKTWLYEENNKKLYHLDDNKDRGQFLDEFFEYRRERGLYCKIPVIARKPLDVFVLYNIVQKYGGFEETMKNRMWSQIARELDLPRTMTSGAFTLKLKYVRLLYQFECYRCRKPVNQSIIYNDAVLSDNVDDIEYVNLRRFHDSPISAHQRGYHHTAALRDGSPPERLDENADFREKTERDYRNALMSLNSAKEMETEDNRVIKGINAPTAFQPYYKEEKPTRKRSMNDDTGDSVDGTRIEGLQNFSVDVIQISEGKISLKVHMNKQIYEGELKCRSAASPYSV